jgi:hypothetical protein
VFACNQCRRVYSLRMDELEPIPTPWGVGPYNPEAPTRVFQVPIECDDLGCSTQLLVHVELKSSTTDEQMVEEIKTWRYLGVKCPKGHDYPDTPWDKGLVG